MINLEQEIIDRVDKNFKEPILIRCLFASEMYKDKNWFKEYKEIQGSANEIFHFLEGDPNMEEVKKPFNELTENQKYLFFFVYIRKVLDTIDWDKYLVNLKTTI